MKLRLGIVAPEAFPTFAGMEGGPIGGAEVQQAGLARHLAARGHEVAFIAGDYGQDEIVTIDGVRAYRTYRPGYGNRYARYASDSLKVFRAMKRCESRVFLQRCVFHQTGRTWLIAKSLGAKFVFSAGDEMNAWHPRQLRDKHIWYMSTYAAAIRGADLVLCQNEDQRDGFARNYDVDAVIVPSIVDTGCYKPAERSRGDMCDVLWVGRLSSRKRPDLFLDLAEQLPQLTFTMVGQKADQLDLAVQVESRAAAMANVRFLGGVAQSRMPEVYQGCRLLVGTSASEGFPNVFLQAMATGLPVVSLTVDPMHVLSRSEGGVSCADDFATLVETVQRLATDEGLRTTMGVRARSHVRLHHAPETVIPLYERLLTAVEGSD